MRSATATATRNRRTRLMPLRERLLPEAATGRHDLCDLARDPGEREDPRGTVPQGGPQAAALTAWEPPLPPVVATTEATPKLERELRALRYVG